MEVDKAAWSHQTESYCRAKESKLIEELSGKISSEDGKLINFLKNWDISQKISHNGLQALEEFVNENLKELLENEIECLKHILSISSVKHYFKQNEKKCMELFEKIVKERKTSDDESAFILNNLLALGLSTEKGVNVFLKKAYASLGSYFDNLENNETLNKPKQQVYQVLKTLFNKVACQKVKQTLVACFHEMPKSSTVLFQSLYLCYKADLPIHIQISYFRFIFQTILSVPNLDDNEILEIFAIISYMMDLPATDFLENSKINENLGIVKEAKKEVNLRIFTEILCLLSKRPFDLNLEICGKSFLDWMKNTTICIIKKNDFGSFDIDALTALVELDLLSIIEKNFSTIFKKVLEIDEKSSLEKFLTTSLVTCIRLQRTNKLLKKLLSAFSSANFSTNQIFSENFLNLLGKHVIVISSTQILNLIQLLLDQLDICVNSLEDDKLNPALFDAVSLLLNTILINCRLICSSMPRSVVEMFTKLMKNFKDTLGQFGTLILQRTHDRKIMQPFLKMCHIWGECHVLILLYTSDELLTLAADTGPSDFSPLLSFLNGDQWSILSERIANFGDHQCNLLLMKLLILKIRVAYLYGNKSLINLEINSKYVQEILKQNVHGLKIYDAMSPEEFSFVFNALAVDKAKTLVKILYEQLITSNDEIFQSWIKNNVLLENRKFVEIVFEIIIRDVGEHCQVKCLELLLQNGSTENWKESISAILHQGCSNKENKLNDRVRKSLTALTSLPYGFIASFVDDPLIIILGIMAALNATWSLLPVFEKLLTYSKNINFDICDCIRWLATHVADRSSRAPIIEQLVVKSTATQAGLAEFKKLIKIIQNDSEIKEAEKVATQIHLHNAIRKCWRQGNDAEVNQVNDVIAKQRKKLNKSLHDALENASVIANDCVLLDAYGIELMRLEREGKIHGIVALNFQSYLNKALKCVKKSINSPERQSGLNFLTTVLKCSAALRNATSNENFVFTIYKRLIGFECTVLWEHVCVAASEKEFQGIMQDVAKNVEMGLGSSDLWECDQAIPDELRPLVLKMSEEVKSKQWSDYYINVWEIFLEKSTGGKQACCFSHLKRMLAKGLNLLPPASSSESSLKWLKFLHHLLTISNLAIRSELEDYVMDVIMAFPETGIDFQQHFVTQLNIIGALIAPQKVPIVRKLHLIFLIYQKLLRWLSRESNANFNNLSTDHVASRALAAFHLEKWVGLLVQRKDEFSTFPLFITELINTIADVTVYPTVKVHMRNAIFHLLAVMDEQQIKTIARSLRPGCQQILTNLHAEFYKFHKYRGKI